MELVEVQQNSRQLELVATLDMDILAVNRLLPPDVSIKLEIIRNSDAFCIDNHTPVTGVPALADNADADAIAAHDQALLAAQAVANVAYKMKIH